MTNNDQNNRRTSLQVILRASAELREEGAPYRVSGRPAYYDVAVMVVRAHDILTRSRHPDRTGFYYRKGNGCCRDSEDYKRIHTDFAELRRLVNDVPAATLETELHELRAKASVVTESLMNGGLIAKGFYLNSLKSRIRHLESVLELRAELGRLESLDYYVAALRRSAK